MLFRLCSIIVERVDFETQMTISHLNRCFAGVVESSAEHQLKKFKRQKIRHQKILILVLAAGNIIIQTQ